jgi:hypothetical protein
MVAYMAYLFGLASGTYLGMSTGGAAFRLAPGNIRLLGHLSCQLWRASWGLLTWDGCCMDRSPVIPRWKNPYARPDKADRPILSYALLKSYKCNARILYLSEKIF